MELILSGRQIRIKDLPTALWILPICVVPLKFIAKAHFFRDYQAERRVVDLNVPCPHGKLKALSC